ncbi:MAG: magnesium transporter [Maritimibacter sp.]|nr:magnesium transporter [Maritimibacter sp.]
MRDRVREAVERRDADELVALIDPMPLSEAMRQLFALDADDRDILLDLLPAELAARLIEEAPHAAAADLVDRMDTQRAAAVLEELDSAARADLIGDLEDDDAEAILAEFDPEDAADVRRLSGYEDETAGGLMVADVFAFRDTQTVAAILRDFAHEDADLEAYAGQHPYVVDKEERPVGVVSLRGLLMAKRTDRLAKIMVAPVLTVPVTATLDELQDLFDRHGFLGLPVVEADGRLVGAVSRQAVHDAALERAESESLKLQGVVGDELRSMPFWLRSRRRLAWLSANIVLNIIAASVISAYEETLAAVIAIAVFLPMVSDMSGCSGNQAVGVSMRELSLGLIQPKDAFRVWRKEVSVGMVNGILLGMLIGAVAWAWKGNPWLGLVIGLALAANSVIAVSIGGVVPLLLKRLGQDPAAASGPLLTTITDMAGFFLVLSLASLMMPLLV